MTRCCCKVAGGFRGSSSSPANSSGTAAAPIRIAAYGNGRATILAGTGDGIRVTNAGGYVIENLVVRGAGVRTNTGVGIFFHSTRRGSAKFDYAHVHNVDVSGFLTAGVQFLADDLYGFSNVTIDGVIAHDNGDSGISTFGRYVQFSEGKQPYAHANVHVTNSVAYRNLGIRGSNTNTGSGIELQSVGGGLIDFNLAHDNGGVGKKTVGGGPVAIWAWDSDSVTIRFNEAYRQQTGDAGDGDGFDLDGGASNCVVEYNYSHDNVGNGFLVTQFDTARKFIHNIFRYNISENDNRQDNNAGLLVSASTGDAAVFDLTYTHNTVWTTPGTFATSGMRVVEFGEYHDVKFLDNIIVVKGDMPVVQQAALPGVTIAGNLYWASGGAVRFLYGTTSYPSLDAYRAASGEETIGGQPTGLVADPLLVAPGQGGTIGDPTKLATLTTYKLQPGSPAIDAALDTARFGVDSGPRDFFGNPRTGVAWDIGAAEYVP